MVGQIFKVSTFNNVQLLKFLNLILAQAESLYKEIVDGPSKKLIMKQSNSHDNMKMGDARGKSRLIGEIATALSHHSMGKQTWQ